MKTPAQLVYRRALARAKCCLSIGRAVKGDDFTPLEITLARMLLHQIQHPDLLELRKSGFTLDSRSRIRLYPLIAR